MLSRSTSPPDGIDTVPLFVRRTATVELQSAANELRDIGWLGVVRRDVEGSARVIATELELPLRSPSSASLIRIPVLMEVGLPEVTGQEVAVDLSWYSTTLAPLFPVFVGRLTVTTKDVRVEGRYAPPFGRVGLLIDRGLLHLVAGRTGLALVGRFVERLSGAR